MPSPKQKLRLRLLYNDDIAIGPGKAMLLENIAETGSIAAAGRRMGMTYRRAWLLVDTMNRCFREPVVLAAKGGVGGGGATVTGFGRSVLAKYRRLESRAVAEFEELVALAPKRKP